MNDKCVITYNKWNVGSDGAYPDRYIVLDVVPPKQVEKTIKDHATKMGLKSPYRLAGNEHWQDGDGSQWWVASQSRNWSFS